MSFAGRVAVILALAVVAVAGMMVVPRIPQDPAYHLFADIRTCFGVPNFGNVASNAIFLLVGVGGLIALYRRPLGARFATFADTVPYAIFFLGTMLVGAGSAYYHWHPDNRTLFWDRLPMTIAFMAFTAAVVADRVHRRAGLYVVLPLLLLAGIGSLLYWTWSEEACHGDLRFYGLVQFLPLFVIPVICWLFPAHSHTAGRYIVAIVAWYALAKLFEQLDVQLYDWLGNAVSGHSLKHLAAGIATACVIPMVGPLTRSAPAPRPAS